MGSWGTGPFENDYALDFVGDFVDDARGLVFLREYLENFLRETAAGYDQSTHWGLAQPAAKIVAACELVAAYDRRGKDIPGNAQGIIDPAARPDGALRATALRAVDVVRASTSLRDIYGDTLDGAYADLVDRLKAP